MKFLRKIVMGTSAIAFTAAALTASTFAWFPTTSIAHVEQTKISVTGGLGFMVSIDNINYSNDLTSTQIKEAILLKYQPDRFDLVYNPATGKSDFHSITVTYEKNELTGETEKVVSDNGLATDDQMNEAWKNIELLPVTSKDGVEIKDLYSSDATASSGRYIDFSVYFKTTASNYYKTDVYNEQDTESKYYTRDEDGNWVEVPRSQVNSGNVMNYYKHKLQGQYVKAETYDSSVQYYQLVDGKYEEVTGVTEATVTDYYVYDGQVYDIYLNGEQVTDTKSGTVISPTKFISAATTSKVGADMQTVVNGTTTLQEANEGSYTVYTANALRLSITDESNESEGEGTHIYELNDYVNGASNYGSYATKYSDLYFNDDPTYSSDLDYMYGYQYNAMYTYYSNLKKSASLQDSPLYARLMEFSEMPTTITDLTSKDSTTGEYLYNKPITRLLSGAEDGTLITFRIWLEGWDADCFDGLKESVQTTLSFTSKRIY